jgi:hypothetical protein
MSLVVERRELLRRGVRLEKGTFGVERRRRRCPRRDGIAAHSIALAAFGFDSLVEIGAAAVVLWELAEKEIDRTAKALRFIGYAFVILVPYVVAVAVASWLIAGHPRHSPYGIGWTAATVVVMLVLAFGKRRTAGAPQRGAHYRRPRHDDRRLPGRLGPRRLGSGRSARWWWADPLASLVVVFYAVQEARHILAGGKATTA